ncbi:hypothetical protein AX15_007919 [Amanita polypyramis BW_CC]|nr:hypothetical protein AX15_007919 [Amanita polypyramis BW_CC]
MAKVRVAVVGAGIGGLMLVSTIAAMDKEKKIEVDIYEAAADLTEIGAGINLWQRSYEMLVNIGLEQDVVQLCERANDSSCEIPPFANVPTVGHLSRDSPRIPVSKE